MNTKQVITKEELITKINKTFEKYSIKFFNSCNHCDTKPYIEEIIKLFKEAGYISPEEAVEQDKRYVEAERINNREAAIDERALRQEIKYYKNKYNELEYRL